jgi:hypothetical protein
MATTISRTIYTSTNVHVNPKATTGAFAGAGWSHVGGTDAILNTAQNATFSLNIPRADVNVFGVEGVLDRPQLEAETATFEFGFIPELNNSPARAASLTAIDMNSLISDTIAELPTYAAAGAAKVGRVKDALMNSCTGEAAVGALANFTVSFTGANDDAADPADRTGIAAYMDLANGLALNVPVKIGAIATKATVVTPQQVSLGVAVAAPATSGLLDETFPDGDGDNLIESCAQSASFAWDVPVELILCLGSNPATDGHALGNPPGSASFTVEALKEQLVTHTAAQTYVLTIGDYTFTLAQGNIDSRTHNLAVGDLFGSYNYVIGGTGDGYTVA